MPAPAARGRGGIAATAPGPRGPKPTADQYKMPPTPQQQDMLQHFLQAAHDTLHIDPPLGFANKAYDQMAGLKRYQQQRLAKGLTAQQRIDTLTQAGATDRQGMINVARRLYASPQEAFMLARGGR